MKNNKQRGSGLKKRSFYPKQLHSMSNTDTDNTNANDSMSTEPRKQFFPVDQELIHAVPGLQSSVGSVDYVETFGDSGDAFDHEYWRDLFHLLASTKAGMQFINGLGQKLLLRGQSEKRNNKSQAQRITFDASKLSVDERKRHDYWKGKTQITFVLNFPSATSRVGSVDLTPERLKCIIRPYIAESMRQQKRFPATSMAIGYGRLVLDLEKILEVYTMASAFTDAIKKADGETEINKIGRTLGLSSMETQNWGTALEVAKDKGVIFMFSVAAAYAGSVSSKEIYMIDELYHPGTVCWSGLHALMTDVSNKNKATYVTADVRERYASSNFYDDFKRKMVARKMTITNSPEYLKFLQSIAIVVPMYIFGSTQIKTEEEVQVIDMIMNKINSLKTDAAGLAKRFETGSSIPVQYETAEEMKTRVNAMHEKYGPTAGKKGIIQKDVLPSTSSTTETKPKGLLE